MDLLTLTLFILGLAALLVGAEFLVRGASRLASLFGIPPLIIGLTVVAFGTSSPELAVGILSASQGQADIAVGNVVGSNICNVLLILGLSAAITPLVVSRQLVRLEVPLMIAVSVLTLLLALDGRVGRLDGLLLFGGLVVYLVWSIRTGRAESTESGETGEKEKSGALKQLLLVAAGLGMLVLGSKWLVDGAVVLARALGLSELIIGLTVIALGTSLPEVATSVLAALRGERDIAVGNVVGSNLFNILAVLGLTAVVAPGGVPVSAAALSFDLPVMIAVAVACLPVFFTGHLIARWEGILFLAYYVIYTAYLILSALQHGALPTFTAAMVWFVLPLTALTLGVGVVRAVRERRG